MLLPRAVVRRRDASSLSEYCWAEDMRRPVSALAVVGPSGVAGVRGVSLRARRHVPAGSVVLRGKSPVAFFIFENKGRCALCASELDGSSLRQCKCGARHCSAECRDLDSDHKLECSSDKQRAPPSCRLAARLLRASSDKDVAAYLDDLIGDHDDDDDDEEVSAAAVVVARLLSGNHSVEASRIKPVLRKLRRNCHTIADDELRGIGVAIYPRDCTAANHSCRPNVWPRFALRKAARPQLEYVALSAIEAGVELAHEYTDVAVIEDRRRHLRADYGFDCKCDRCQEDEEAVIAKNKGGAATELADRRQALEAAISARDFASAAGLATAMLPLVEGGYPAGHPQPALHLLMTAKLLLAVNEPHDARKHLLVALPRLALTHGEDGRLPTLAREVLKDATNWDDDPDASSSSEPDD